MSTDRSSLPFVVHETEVTLGNRTMVWRSDIAGYGKDADGQRFWNLIAAAVESNASVSPPVVPAVTDSNGQPLHNRKTVQGGGPDICDECSYAAHNYVRWPCSAVVHDEAKDVIALALCESVNPGSDVQEWQRRAANGVLSGLRSAGFLIVKET